MLTNLPIYLPIYLQEWEGSDDVSFTSKGEIEAYRRESRQAVEAFVDRYEEIGGGGEGEEQRGWKYPWEPGR